MQANTAWRVFGNLPLCVSIYSFLEAALSKKKDLFDSTDSNKMFSFAELKSIETKFGDRFHVRGLDGILKIAEKSIDNKPFALMLLWKVS